MLEQFRYLTRKSSVHYTWLTNLHKETIIRTWIDVTVLGILRLLRLCQTHLLCKI